MSVNKKYLILGLALALLVLIVALFLLNQRSSVKQRKEAQWLLEAQKETEGKNISELMAAGQKLFQENNPKKAAIYFEKAAEQDKNYRDAWVMAGYANLSAQNPKQARIFLRRAVNLDPAYGLTHELLAKLYEQLGYPNLAKQERQKAQGLGLKP